MSADGAEISSGEQMYLLDKLRGLLEKQVELAHQGDSTGEEFNSLTARVASIVGKLTRSGILESTEYKSQREQLRKLYQDLCVTLTAQQAKTTEELSHVRKGRKTIEAYRNNI